MWMCGCGCGCVNECVGVGVWVCGEITITRTDRDSVYIVQ